MTLQNYLDMYKKPLTDSTMKAILKLTEVAGDKKLKKMKKKKGKTADNEEEGAKIKGKKKRANKETKQADKKTKKEKISIVKKEQEPQADTLWCQPLNLALCLLQLPLLYLEFPSPLIVPLSGTLCLCWAGSVLLCFAYFWSVCVWGSGGLVLCEC
jgi:hypothetical protein